MRPAAVEQLSILAEKISVPVYKEDTKDALKVAKMQLALQRKNGLNTIIVDTAGRMQVDEDMMAEIKSIKKHSSQMKPFLLQMQ